MINNNPQNYLKRCFEISINRVWLKNSWNHVPSRHPIRERGEPCPKYTNR